MQREESAQPRAATTEIEGRGEVTEALAALGARGELVLHDGACTESTLSLPALERRESSFPCPPTGARSPDGRLVARCVDRRVEVFSAVTGDLRETHRGCVPAWLPTGGLTAERAGAVVRLSLCATCSHVAIPLTELERAARLHPRVPTGVRDLRPVVESVAWLTHERAAVSISVRLGRRFDRLGPLSVVAFFTNGRLDATPPYLRVTGGRLGASPRGSYVTLTPDVILRPDGSQVSLPQHLRDARAFAWSPDERFLALATRFSVVVIPVASLEAYDRDGGGLRSVTVPQRAADIHWR